MSMKLMVRVLEEVALTRPQTTVLLAMAENANDDGSRCFPSVDLIAWRAGYKPRNVVIHIRELKELGVLEVVEQSRFNRPTEYAIHLDQAPRKPSFTEWQEEYGRRSRRTATGAEEVQNGAFDEHENAPLNGKEGCIPVLQGVQSHAQGVHSGASEKHENAPDSVREPVHNPVREPVHDAIASRTSPEPPPIRSSSRSAKQQTSDRRFERSQDLYAGYCWGVGLDPTSAAADIGRGIAFRQLKAVADRADPTAEDFRDCAHWCASQTWREQTPSVAEVLKVYPGWVAKGRPATAEARAPTPSATSRPRSGGMTAREIAEYARDLRAKGQ